MNCRYDYSLVKIGSNFFIISVSLMLPLFGLLYNSLLILYKNLEEYCWNAGRTDFKKLVFQTKTRSHWHLIESFPYFYEVFVLKDKLCSHCFLFLFLTITHWLICIQGQDSIYILPENSRKSLFFWCFGGIEQN